MEDNRTPGHITYMDRKEPQTPLGAILDAMAVQTRLLEQIAGNWNALRDTEDSERAERTRAFLAGQPKPAEGKGKKR